VIRACFRIDAAVAFHHMVAFSAFIAYHFKAFERINFRLVELHTDPSVVFRMGP